MVGSEKLLIALITGTLGYIPHKKKTIRESHPVDT